MGKGQAFALFLSLVILSLGSGEGAGGRPNSPAKEIISRGLVNRPKRIKLAFESA
jgi:hypothetical protein